MRRRVLNLLQVFSPTKLLFSYMMRVLFQVCPSDGRGENELVIQTPVGVENGLIDLPRSEGHFSS